MSNKLPFLHSQILEYVYWQIHNKNNIRIDDISEVTGYPSDSKILLNAISKLESKKYIVMDNGEISFNVPNESYDFYKHIIQKHEEDVKFEPKKDYLKEIWNMGQTTLLEYNEGITISELNRKGIVHHWYDYLEDFPYDMVQNKLKEFKTINNIKTTKINQQQDNTYRYLFVQYLVFNLYKVERYLLISQKQIL